VKIHFCPLVSECRRNGAPARLTVSTKRWHLGIACAPNGRYVRMPRQYSGDMPPRSTWERAWIDFKRKS
jgi:hypothetical protein